MTEAEYILSIIEPLFNEIWKCKKIKSQPKSQLPLLVGMINSVIYQWDNISSDLSKKYKYDFYYFEDNKYEDDARDEIADKDNLIAFLKNELTSKDRELTEKEDELKEVKRKLAASGEVKSTPDPDLKEYEKKLLLQQEYYEREKTKLDNKLNQALDQNLILHTKLQKYDSSPEEVHQIKSELALLKLQLEKAGSDPASEINRLNNELKKSDEKRQRIIEQATGIINEANDKLRKKGKVIKDLNEKIDTLNQKLKEKSSLLEQKNSELAAKDEAIAKLRAEIQRLLNPPEPEPIISHFTLPEAAAPFTGDLPAMLQKLETAISSIQPVADYLEKSDYRSAPSYLSTILKHAEGLTRLREDAPGKAPEYEDERSEWLTEKYLGIFRRGMFTSVLPGVARGYEDNPDFYEPFLKLLNGCLSASGFYTRKVAPGHKMTDEDYMDMEFVKETVEDAKKDNTIDYVERLPYYIKYETPGGESDHFYYPGKMIVLKADAQ